MEIMLSIEIRKNLRATIDIIQIHIDLLGFDNIAEIMKPFVSNKTNDN